MTQQTQSSTNQDPGYEMDGVTGFGNGGTSSPWSPGDMQNKIDELMGEMAQERKDNPNKDLTFFIMYLMYLMQSYGGQVIGQDGDKQTNMNKLVAETKDLWTQMQAAGHEGCDYPAIQKAFDNDVKEIQDYVKNDPFFKQSDGTPTPMATTILNLTTQLQNAADSTTKDSFGKGTVGLEALWVNADPSSWGVSGSQGDSTGLSQVNDELGELNAQGTGASNVMGSIAKVHVQNDKSEEDSFSNFIKALQSILKYFTQTQRTG